MTNDSHGANGKLDSLEQRPLDLPFCNLTIRLNAAGAKATAWLACKMAERHASAIELHHQYARRCAAFLTGNLAAQCPDERQKLLVFEIFLDRVTHWINRVYGCCLEEMDWSLFNDVAGELRPL